MVAQFTIGGEGGNRSTAKKVLHATRLVNHRGMRHYHYRPLLGKEPCPVSFLPPTFCDHEARSPQVASLQHMPGTKER